MQNHNLICNSVLIQGLPRQAWIRLAKSRNQLENPFPQLVVSSRPWLFLKLKFLIQTTPWGECMHNDNTCKTLEHPHRAFLLQFSLRWPFSSVPTISFPLSISDITRILPLRFLFFFFPHILIPVISRITRSWAYPLYPWDLPMFQNPSSDHEFSKGYM